MAATFEDIAKGKYVLLTTFKKDGTGVPTPLWGALDGDRLLVWTVSDSWKVKRIRRNPAVTLAPCDMRGNPQGDAVDARAEILDADRTEKARAAIASKYGILGWLTVKGSVLRRGKSGSVGLAITAAS
ncbi:MULTISPECIES: PPOX class F420-dependent oxidoreductase [unclassified Rhodococcus (in: high G+C Gram-positive bacteria)]|uniref:PPOX class F420-dependent oxidoreductase n=1 Tax=unclassified Rhodococcus (in: high G+C Gram-positive bacteria) TaxID=192944 RepID=UPI0007BB7493|nr:MULTISPECIES: PPOX class F420-dependent oxidoreductase [unclassified Rhodococcus (in: high G+C Gram-positive bacteria)]KZF04531.1 PPOX class F420-dependent enzyme [Rhodococcus sp. EPR-147]KZF10686.1 PPOX class F420-dependent enzyme [Rhodococcus sp. EPR-279]OZE31379.1 PPOX class F420-dependent oxidoreductase [Rhodococcus sp. 05-2254-4]OZE41712.1 PPOX class F420-dependent oxidoreductase [Rhodococcus sp. 05-2254-3]OZE52147.1 PPOX class F420-dependent oxidoreductase [Rhodococcus sp. 05-2254-2]